MILRPHHIISHVVIDIDNVTDTRPSDNVIASSDLSYASGSGHTTTRDRPSHTIAQLD